MKRFLFAWCLCAALLAAPAAWAAEVNIGLMCPLTGKWASEGQDMQKIVSLLVNEVNAAGGAGGNTLNLIVEDDAGDPRSAALAAQKLLSQDVVAIIGTYGSAVTEATQNIIAESDVVQVGTASTSVRLTEKGLPLFFRTCPRDDSQGVSAAALIKQLAKKKVAILHDNSSYAKGLAEETKALLNDGSSELVFFDALTPGERDYTAILTKLKATGAELVFYTGYYPEMGALLRQCDQMAWDNVVMMGGDATNHPDLVKIAGANAAEGFYFVSPPMPQDLDSESARSFLVSFEKAYGGTPSSIWAVIAGDAFKAISAAIAAGNTDAEDIGKAMHGFTDLPALTGNIGFNEKGDRVGSFYRTYIVDANGTFVLQP